MLESPAAAPPQGESYATVEHFRDGHFFNPGVKEHGFRELFRWISTRKVGPWRKWIPSEPGPPPPPAVAESELRVTFVNHSTVLLQTGRVNVLTDPVWSERVSPVSFSGPKRHRAPGI